MNQKNRFYKGTYIYFIINIDKQITVNDDHKHRYYYNNMIFKCTSAENDKKKIYNFMFFYRILK